MRQGQIVLENYSQQLHPWCIIRLLPNMQRATVNRFRRRNDAAEHMRVLRRLNPQATYTVIFVPPQAEKTES
jgi:hypothetical protein